MNRLRGLSFVFIGALLIASCTPAIDQDDKEFTITATTGIIADAAARIAGDSAKVIALMGPGVDPHLYKTSQNDLSRLMEADIIFYNGLHLEGKMTEVLEKLAKQKKVYAVTEGLLPEKLRNVSDFAGGYDPHVWFDVQLWKDVVVFMSLQMQKADPGNKEYYQQNTREYIAELEALDEWVKHEISRIPESQRVLITAHDAFGYFGDAYDIEVRGLQGISTLTEPGLRDISEITDLIVDKNIKAIFVESSVPVKTVESVVEGARLKGQEVKIGGTLYSDALGPTNSEAGTYTGMVRTNVSAIVSALK